MGNPDGIQDRFLVSAGDTDGRFAVVEHILAPRALAAPMHHHSREDEFSFIIEGEVGAVLGGHEATARAGDLLFKPRGEWHTFWNAGDTTARIIEVISPAGLDDLFRALDSLADWPEPGTLADMAAAYGCAIDLEATMPLIEKHQMVF
jgi:mannose-6-phosphate isomerase-like protein (cupin superfamily)